VPPSAARRPPLAVALLPLAVAVPGLAAPASAPAAEVALTRPCYLQGAQAGLTGSGFAPNAPLTIARDGTPIGTATTDALGAMAVSFPTPRLTPPRKQRAHRLTVSDGMTTAITTLRVSAFDADFRPGTGNPATLRVRFSLAGFALLDSAPSVYVHYVRPNGRLRRTVRLGRARGACGHISRTARRKLFPFRAERGTWRLQFDTRRTYSRGTGSSDFLFFVQRVSVTRRRR
jgi:hypothetical protein